MTTRSESILTAARRLVIKVGSSLLVNQSSGAIHRQWMDSLAADIARCRARGQDIILVTSGAVAVGRRHLNLTPPLRLDEKQAAAATGQIRLAHAWQESLAAHSITVAQMLLTLEDSEDRQRYINARNTLDTLLRLKAVPVINENDTVATAELRFGDNDRLAARVAQMAGADVLVLFSDIDGLYTADPRKHPQAEFIPEVHELTPEIEAMAGNPGSAVGSGGMITKLLAARICLAAGCRMAVAMGQPLHPLDQIEQGGRCTWFIPKVEPKASRKQWILGALSPAGTVTVDDGAAKALIKGGSLLPAGITAIDGSFEAGDCVLIQDARHKILGRGLSAYAAADALRIVGRKSAEFEAILGYRGQDELIHRDDLVMGA